MSAIRSERRLNLSTVPSEKRKQTWAMLQRDYPDQAAWVQDPFVQEMREHFDAQLIVYLPENEIEKGN
jgi:hypothetical protein